MICIEVTYRDWWWPLERHAKGVAPTRWWELTERQFLAIVGAVTGRLDKDGYLSALTGLPRRLVGYLDDWSRYTLERQLRWVDDEKSEASRLFVGRIEGLEAPADTLAGMPLQQYMTVDTYFAQYTETMGDGHARGDEEKLCMMVGALYLRRDESYFPTGGERLADLGGNAAMLLRRADRLLLDAVWLNWVLIRNWLARAYPLLFPTPDEGDAKQKQQRRRNAWLDAFDAFMGDDVAHMDQYRRMAATDAFRLMNKRIQRNLTKK